ncbi:hypothetical protein [Sporisorium scitamineum]|nr:hypothetical protein [Sporisorium scitamineum]
MRKALHNQNLEINSLEPSYASNPRLFIAFDSKNPEDRHAKTFDPSQPLPPSHSAPVTSGNLHFIQGFAKPTKIKLRELPWVNPVFRRLIYLDSQSNMDYISNEYFGGHMRFLPIDVEQL